MDQNSHLPRIFISSNPINRSLQLTSEQCHYLSRVLRLKPGDRFISQTSQGQRWLSQLDSTLKEAELLETLPPLPNLTVQVILLAALPKTGFDEVVRQTTELGVSQIVPVFTTRTLLKPSAHKHDRWQRIAQEAAEQCERAQVPHLSSPCSFQDALRQLAPTPHRYLCVARAAVPPLGLRVQRSVSYDNRDQSPFADNPDPFPDSRAMDSANPPILVLATGPEGGWTPEEVVEAENWGFEQVSLGPLILRAVTAPIAALAMIMGNFQVHYPDIPEL